MNLEARVVGDVHVLTPHHNLVGGKETEELLAAFNVIADNGTPHVIVDLGEIELVSSLGISALVKIHTSCVTRQGWLRLVRINRRIHDVLVITRLIMVFETYETIEEAMVGQIAHEERNQQQGYKAEQPARQVAQAGSDTPAVPRGSAAGKT